MKNSKNKIRNPNLEIYKEGMINKKENGKIC